MVIFIHFIFGEVLFMQIQQCTKKISSVQLLSYFQLFETPWTAARQASLSITSSQSLLKLMPIEAVMTAKHFILFCPLLLLSSILPSIRVFSNESVLCIRWPKYWEFQLQHQFFQWIFRTDFLKVGLVGYPWSPRDSPETLQHNSSKASILQYSAFFIVQLSHSFMTTGKTIALIRQISVAK